MGMRKYLIIGVCISVSLVLLSAVAVSGINFTGLFKAFDKTLYPGETYERNITVRKYYNVSVRFRKENSSSYLGFTDNQSVILLKDSSGAEVLNVVGVHKGKIYSKMDNYELGSVATVSAYNISDYEDVINQPVDDDSLSFIGSKAYITVVVREKMYQQSIISGYVIDDLTGELVDGVSVYAFENNADVNTSSYEQKGVSDESGKYVLDFELGNSKALDIYVGGYDVV